MSRDAIGQEVDHQDSACDEQDSSLGVNIITLCALDIAGHRPGQVGHTLQPQLLCEILLRREHEEETSFAEQGLSNSTHWLLQSVSVKL